MIITFQVQIDNPLLNELYRDSSQYSKLPEIFTLEQLDQMYTRLEDFKDFLEEFGYVRFEMYVDNVVWHPY